MNEPDEDVRLMLALQAGDVGAFGQLFERWVSPLLRFLERMVRDVAVAEELVQETFLRVYRARDRYAADARFSTWLYRIATNIALNELRRPRRRYPHTSLDATYARARAGAASDGGVGGGGPLLEIASAGEPLDELVEQRRTLDRTREALDQVPDRQRAALWLSAVEGLSYAEVATALDTSEKSVKALVHRARASLAAKLPEASKPGGPARKRERQAKRQAKEEIH